jgi:hypothetical protein
MAEYVLVEKSDGVAILTMNRPAQLTTKVVRGAKAESAFPEFIARKGRN